jgi:hypothetical protein
MAVDKVHIFKYESQYSYCGLHRTITGGFQLSDIVSKKYIKENEYYICKTCLKILRKISNKKLK